MKHRLLIFLVSSLLLGWNGRAFAAVFDYSVVICGIPTAMALWTSRLNPPAAMASVGAGIACTSVYYGFLAIAQSGVFSSLSEEQAEEMVSRESSLADAVTLFGRDVVIKVLKLPREKQTADNIQKIIFESLSEDGAPPEA